MSQENYVKININIFGIPVKIIYNRLFSSFLYVYGHYCFTDITTSMAFKPFDEGSSTNHEPLQRSGNQSLVYSLMAIS